MSTIRPRGWRSRPQAGEPGPSTILYDMSTIHIPVLAGELIGLLDRAGIGARPGQVAIDCTFGGGGHARLVAQRLGPTAR